MYCRNCGNQLKEEENFCGVCGTSRDLNINTTPVPTPQQLQNVNEKKDNDTANILSAISLILFTGGSYIFNMVGLPQLSGVSGLAGLTILIYTRIKYPKNIFAKILMWLAIILFILWIFFIFLFFISCSVALRDCNGIG